MLRAPCCAPTLAISRGALGTCIRWPPGFRDRLQRKPEASLSGLSMPQTQQLRRPQWQMLGRRRRGRSITGLRRGQSREWVLAGNQGWQQASARTRARAAATAFSLSIVSALLYGARGGDVERSGARLKICRQIVCLSDCGGLGPVSTTQEVLLPFFARREGDLWRCRVRRGAGTMNGPG